MKTINELFQVALFVFTAKPKSLIDDYNRNTIGFQW